MAEKPLEEAQPLAVFTVPQLGVDRTHAIQELPPNALYDSSNVLVRLAQLQARPGLTQLHSQVFGARPTGATVYRDTANNPIPVVGTTTGVWSYASGLWSSRSDITLSGTSAKMARFTPIVIGGINYLVMVNGVDSPRQWNGTDGTFIPILGSPPVWSDVVTAFDRVVGVIPPYELRWGEALRLDLWNALNFRTLADTPDPIVAISALGTVGLAVYKRETIWNGYQVGGPSSGAFKFELRGYFEGPASPAAIVRANGVDYYMTPTGRIGAYDGNTQQWVSDAIWPLMRESIDTNRASRISGAFDAKYNELHFFYPRIGDN